MTPLGWVVIVLVVVAIAAFSGIKPRGSRPVANTQLMSVARVVFVLLALLLAYFVLRR